ncbi:MAG: alkaline phosphatase family protein [Candidatus Thermoplasmatota archaeon]|nr:alkaline phosphatase family protein [Candidatus Thermoplasmatota archaeon]MDA8144146.1 alkaline phosphatase family protein [Thermoplasmatales archaeon]
MIVIVSDITALLLSVKWNPGDNRNFFFGWRNANIFILQYSQALISIKLISVFVLALMILPMVSENTASNTDTTKTPIKHLIILMMENHSFDNLFGVYPNNPANNTTGQIIVPINLLSHPVNQNLTAVQNGSFQTSNPTEGYSNYHVDWNNGKMNNFLNGSGPSSMYYFTVNQMAIEWDLAQQFSLADMYFSSTLSETLPNRLYSLAGYSQVKQDQIFPTSYLPVSQTIFSEMSSHNVSWNYYFRNPSLGNYPLDFISGINKFSGNIAPWSSFTNSLQNGTLPDVSFVSMVSGGAYGYSQHPPDSVLPGQLMMLYITEQLMKSRYWNNSALIVTYDEGGGYYDQVAPPVTGGHQLGFRVPFILISPYAKEGYVSNTVMNHGSILAFIDYNWNLPALNYFVSKANLPLDLFNFNHTYSSGNVTRPPITFPDQVNRFLPTSMYFSPLDINSAPNLSSVFPLVPQIPYNSLPYNRTGSSDVNLSQFSSQVYVSSNFGYTPLYFQDHFLEGVSAALILAVIGIAYLQLRRKKKI